MKVLFFLLKETTGTLNGARTTDRLRQTRYTLRQAALLNSIELILSESFLQ